MLKFINISIIIVLSLTALKIKCQTSANKTIAVGFYNLENLFDTIDAPDIIDEEFTPNGDKLWNSLKYHQKLHNMSEVISQMASSIPGGLALLGVAEIENRNVVEDLIHEKTLADRNYQIIHFESNDRRGIDLAVIYSPKHFSPISAVPVPVDLFEGTEKIFTRDILWVTGNLEGEKVNILLNHWPSRAGGESKTAPWRATAASKCRQIIDSIQTIEPGANFIIMGDLNDDPTSPSIKKSLYTSGKINKIDEKQVFNPFESFYIRGIGTTSYKDAWSLFDQLMITKGLTDNDGLKFVKAFVFNKDFMIQKTGKFKGYPLRTFVGNEFNNGYSDHFPVYIYLKK